MLKGTIKAARVKWSCRAPESKQREQPCGACHHSRRVGEEAGPAVPSQHDAGGHHGLRGSQHGRWECRVMDVHRLGHACSKGLLRRSLISLCWAPAFLCSDVTACLPRACRGEDAASTACQPPALTCRHMVRPQAVQVVRRACPGWAPPSECPILMEAAQASPVTAMYARPACAVRSSGGGQGGRRGRGSRQVDLKVQARRQLARMRSSGVLVWPEGPVPCLPRGPFT